jgi:hypothetical protein
MPFECDKLLHPFQNDPGMSQSARVMAALLGGPAQIDGRSMADLLQFFVSLAPNIVYYDQNLNPGVWTPFFQKSLPFLLAGLSNFTTDSIDSKLTLYAYLFKKKPSGSGLQLNLFYIYYNLIRQVNNWSCQLAGSQLPIETTINKLIVNKLKQPVLQFIGIVNAAVKWYGVKKVDFSPLVNNPAWGLDVTDLYTLDTAFKKVGPSQRKRLLALEREAAALVPSFAAALGILAGEAPGNIQQSLTPVAAELQQNHQPHLALIFVFLQLFLKLQCDINGFKKEHLDFFYTNVLQLKPQAAVPDKANLIVYLQNQVQSFALQKGWLVKDGKDNNKADILFGLDDTIAANVAQATDIRTLFFNNQTEYQKVWTEGAYMAPNATMADGVSIAFTGSPNNYPTLGAKYSKYTPPLASSSQAYPGARIGFLLASNVLFLNEGTRHVHIRLHCKVEADACGTDEDYPAFVDPAKLYPFVEEVLQHAYVEITEDLIQQAVQQGVSQSTGSAITARWLVDDCHKSICGVSGVIYYKDNAVIRWHDWNLWLNGEGFSAGEVTIINLLFLKIYPFNVNFSGAKQWIAPEELRIEVDPPGPGPLIGNAFDIHIHARLGADQPAVTFYSAKALGEDFNTTAPVVKIELNDVIKVHLGTKVQNALGLTPSGACCLDVPFEFCGARISLYQLFRFVKLTRTHIHVKVLGVKNFIVQNDDSLQSVNSPILPWGSRPKVSSNFYIGCEEIFLKHWENININVNWKDFPPTPPVAVPPWTGPFNYYYNGYQDSFANGATEHVVLDSQFQMTLSLLQDGEWKPWSRLTPIANPNAAPPCATAANINIFQPGGAQSLYQITRAADFAALGPPKETVAYLGLKQLDVNTRQSFIKITMLCQDFQHDRYAYALARQMSAFGKLPTLIDGAVYFGMTPGSVFIPLDINLLLADVLYMAQLANDTPAPNPTPLAGNGGLVDQINTNLAKWKAHTQTGHVTLNNIWTAYMTAINAPATVPTNVAPGNYPGGMDPALQAIFAILKSYETGIAATNTSMGVVIPNLPWTPTITGMSLDYEAVADERSISLIHLYPFTGTYEAMQIRLHPPLFPKYCDEGTLFVGLSGLVPGNQVNFLFQLAEATANSESNAATVYYSYLAGNQWLPLRPGYEVLNDYTEGLTRTGILELALPANMTSNNTVMPGGLWWIKAAVAQNVEAVAETLVIQTQAISATFVNSAVNDQTRMGTPLPAGSLSRLATNYSQVKSIGQPYPSFGGAPPEAQGAFYVRVSELLHHKGRAIQKFDYERLVLQKFPVIFKAKCINHSLALDAELYKNDFPIAPGYVLLAVIPDLNQLAAGNSLEPKVPVSILEDIYTYISGLTSPFVRLRIMNPRYETINFCIEVMLLQGYDQNFFQQQLATDLSQFLAPWAVGQYSKLTFGQPVYRSDVVGFIESLYYIDYIIKFQMLYEDETTLPLHPHLVIYGKTPRSILIGGDIEVDAHMPKCPKWGDKDPCKLEQFKVRDCDSVIKKEEKV